MQRINSINALLTKNFGAPLSSQEHLQNLTYSAVENALFGITKLDKEKSQYCIEVSKFCIENFIDSELIKKEYILELHKKIIPDNFYTFFYRDAIKQELKIVKRGVFRDINTYLTLRGHKVDFVDYREIDSQIEIMLDKYNNSKKTIANISDVILESFRIHPFMEGNGKTFRVMFDLLLIKNNYYPSLLNITYQKNKSFFWKIFNYYFFVDKTKALNRFLDSLVDVYKVGYFSK